MTGFRPQKPIITHMKDAFVTPGQNVTWKCASESDLEQMFLWYRLNFTGEKYERISIKTEKPQYLTITDVQESDFGTYQCVVTNNLGSDTRNVTLGLDMSRALPTIKREQARHRMNFLITSVVFLVFFVVGVFYLFKMRIKLNKKRVTVIQAKQSFIIRKKVVVERRDSDKMQLTPSIKIEEEMVHVDPQEQANSNKVMNQYQFQPDPDWELSRNCLDIDWANPIGEGAFGIVYKADAFALVPNVPSIEVAVKMLKDNHSESDLRDLVTEMEVMKKVQGGLELKNIAHKNIINLLGCVTQDGTLLLIK